MSSKDTLDNFPKYKTQLANLWINWEVVGRKTKSVSMDFEESLEPDGRRRNKAIAILSKEGYLNLVDGRIQITSKAFNEIKEAKPDFAKSLEGISDISGNKLPNGFAWNILPLEVKKYIFTHQSEFYFFYDPDYYVRNGTPFTVKFGDPAPAEARYYQLMVGNKELTEAREKFLAEKEFQKLRKLNFFLGLEKLGLVSNEHADYEALEKASKIFGISGISDDPGKWDQYTLNKINSLQESIDHQVRLLGSLITIKDKISNYGGWEKFLIDYDQCIRDVSQTDKDNEPS